MNAGAALVWQLWWPLLPFFLLLTSRAWCAVCPFSTLGSLVQRLRPSVARLPSPGTRRAGAWSATAALGAMGFLFLLLTLESNGPFTAALLLVFAAGAAGASLFWRGRVWCRYICPLGLMAGLYSRLAWLRLEVVGDAEKPGAAGGYSCPVFTSPGSPRRTQDCVLCSACLKAPGGEAVAVRFGPPSFTQPLLTPPEAVTVSLLLGLLLVDALRMTPPYLRYMAWAVPLVRDSYETAMALGIAGSTALLLLVQIAATLLSARGRWSWQQFARLSMALLPLALASQLALSAQHLMAAGEVIRNLGAELGLLAPGHMPPTDAYVVVWPLKALQWSTLAAGGALSVLQVARGAGSVRAVPIFGAALLAAVLLAIFLEPMSISC